MIAVPRRLPTSPLVLTLADRVLAQIDRRLAEPEPEQGGALLRPVNGRAVTRFEWDELAATTQVSYVPSDELIARIARLESAFDLRLTGVVHSHPNGMNRLSGPDLHATRRLLQQNRHLGWVCMPVVTQVGDERPLGEHEVLLPHGRMSCFVARLDAADRLRLARPAAVRIVPVEQVSLAVSVELGWRREPWESVSLGGVDLLGCPFEPAAGGPLVWVLLSHDFPFAAPIVALDHGDGLVLHPLPVAAATDPVTAIDQLVGALRLLGIRTTAPTSTGRPERATRTETEPR